jgi:hypothetical protein
LFLTLLLSKCRVGFGWLLAVYGVTVSYQHYWVDMPHFSHIKSS